MNVDESEARVELRLSQSNVQALAAPVPEPHPHQGWDHVFRSLREGEEADLAVALLPMSQWEQWRQRRRLLRAADQPRDSFFFSLLRQSREGGQGRGPATTADRGMEVERLKKRVNNGGTMFWAQVLAWARTEAPGRSAKTLVNDLRSPFGQWDDQNWWRAAGVGVPLWRFFGPDTHEWSRRWHDLRRVSGLFMPASGFPRPRAWRRHMRRPMVTAAEIAAFFSPTSVFHDSRVPLRAGGFVPPAPMTLVAYHHQPGIYPVGVVVTPEGPQWVGAPLADLFFSLVCGKTRFGKSSLVRHRVLHACLVEKIGAFVVDPEGTLDELEEYLTRPGVAERVTIIDFKRLNGMAPQPGWNPLSMEGADRSEMWSRLEGFRDAFVVMQGWNSAFNSRAVNLATQAMAVLMDLNWHLCQIGHPEDQATVFQIPWLLSLGAAGDRDKRILPAVAPGLRKFWANEFKKMANDAVPAVTHLIHTMAMNPAMKALVGQSRSTYDSRRAIEERQITLLCPGDGEIRNLAACLFFYDTMRCLRQRPNKALPLYWMAPDELLLYGTAVSTSLPDMIDTVAKRGGRLDASCIDPLRLHRATRQALMTNKNLIQITGCEADSAKFFSEQTGKQVAPSTFQGLNKYHFISTVDQSSGGTSSPFPSLVLPLPDLWSQHRGSAADVERLERQVERRMRAQTPAQVEEHQEGLEQRILDWLPEVRRWRMEVTPSEKGGFELALPDEDEEPARPGDGNGHAWISEEEGTD